MTSGHAGTLDGAGLHKRFVTRRDLAGRATATVDALVDVYVSVAAASIHGVVGVNGSGKSTLLRIFATLLLPERGAVTVGGVDALRDARAARRRVGFSTGDERSLYWRLTGRENLSFYAALHDLADPGGAIAAVLEAVELTEVADRRVNTYSQGMVRRLGVARALLHSPAVLILDEPARSLDPSARDHLHGVLRTQAAAGTTVLMSTHDLGEAAALCDRVTVLHMGQKVTDLDRPDEAALAELFRGR